MRFIFLLGIFFFSRESAWARVFDFKNEYLASYLRGSTGLSQVGTDAFSGAGGTDTLYNDKVSYNFSGEIGFLLRMKNAFNFRVGIELLQAKPLHGVPGKNTAGDNRFNLDSEILIYQPVGTLEFDLYPKNNSRAFIFLGAGLADATLENQFTLTTTGQSELGISDFTEKALARRISYHAGVGYEVVMADTVTVSCELGYRYLTLPNFKWSKSTTSLAQGAVSTNDDLLNDDGSNRVIDMSGFFVSLGFRFYIDFVR